MKKIIIGDIHGRIFDYGRISGKRFFDIVNETDDQAELICVGDVGFINSYESIDLLQKYGLKFRSIQGNHEHFPSLISKSWFIPNLSIEEWDNLKVMFVGGASSIDRNSRVAGHDWFEEEQLSMPELYKALDLYEKEEPDILIAHTGPASFVENHIPFKYWYSDATVVGGCHIGAKPRTESVFDLMFQIHQPKMWFMGHWHIDIDQIYQGTRFIVLNELSTFDLEI